jgi:DNA primase
LSICAILGTQVRAERLAFLQRTRRVLIVFDSDEPGREAASDLARRLGSRARIVELPDGVKDLNDLGRRPDGQATFFRLVGDIERERNEPQEADEDVAEAQQA